MDYTLWSRGRLLGRTDLGFIDRSNSSRMGWFYPEDGVQDLLDIATGVSPAMVAIGAAENDADREQAEADVQAAIDRCDALELEMRGPKGQVIETEDIGLRDTAWLMSLGEQRMEEDEAWYASLSDEERAEFDESIEHDLAIILEQMESSEDEPWRPEPPESEYPRYQLLIRLVDDRDVP